MAQAQPSPFRCPACGAAYKVVRVEGAEDAELTCRSCGGPLPSRDGAFMLKYFLMEGHRRRKRAPA